MNARDDELVAGTDANLHALQRFLAGWTCCEAPRACGKFCQANELHHVLAVAAHLVNTILARRHIAANAYRKPTTPESPVRQAVWRYEQSLRQLEEDGQL